MFTATVQIFALIAHLVTTLVRVALPGGVRAVIAELLLLKHQLLILNRSRNRAPRLTPWDRLLLGVGAFLVAPNRLPKIAIGIKPATLLRFHRTPIQQFAMDRSGRWKEIESLLPREPAHDSEPLVGRCDMREIIPNVRVKIGIDHAVARPRCSGRPVGVSSAVLLRRRSSSRRPLRVDR